MPRAGQFALCFFFASLLVGCNDEYAEKWSKPTYAREGALEPFEHWNGEPVSKLFSKLGKPTRSIKNRKFGSTTYKWYRSNNGTSTSPPLYHPLLGTYVVTNAIACNLVAVAGDGDGIIGRMSIDSVEARHCHFLFSDVAKF